MINSSQIGRLEKLAELKRIGALTDEEFDIEKKKVLSMESAVNKSFYSELSYSQPFSIPLHEGSPMEWVFRPINKYADFNGRSQRKEFWMFTLFMSVVYFLLFSTMIGSEFGGEWGFSGWFSVIILIILAMALLVPTVAVQVRRFHDQDLTGWFALLNLIPYVGGIIILIFMCIDGTPGPNRYGPNPKEA